MNIVIVESPAKAKTINKYLGSGYEVLASFGHIRDLPPKDGSVRPEQSFDMDWQIDRKATDRIRQIAAAVKGADRLILATDPDREGEAISWHVLEVLKQKRVLGKKAVERVVFNAITERAVREAMSHPREIDHALVEAYLARRALDYLVGFSLSPVLWRKLPGARSAGRVQSVALRLVCNRENEIEIFKPREYWSIDADLDNGEAGEDAGTLTARLVTLGGKKVGKHDIGDKEAAEKIVAQLKASSFFVQNIEVKPQNRNPQPPFTTSTLQQEASRKLGMAPGSTMRVAQRLYEGVDIGDQSQGLITYMRTDGVQIAGEAITQIRKIVTAQFGASYLPDRARAYSVKAKNAQEAHEAIRPTNLSLRPSDVAKILPKDQSDLYRLIWNRAVASQMESARFERTAIDISTKGDAGEAGLRANGSRQLFDGFLRLYQEGRDDEKGDDGVQNLPALQSGQELTRRAVRCDQHFTEPPPRFSEATLIKKMEELGIGRPSTYASTLQTLHDRDYVRSEKKRLFPKDKGRLVTAFLESYFTTYVGYDFTAEMEEQLDLISAGSLDRQQVLGRFWQQFSAALEDISSLRVSNVLENLNSALSAHIFPDAPDGEAGNGRKCPSCADGKLSLKTSRYGAFVGCENYPDCSYTRPLVAETAGDENAAPSSQLLGEDPQSGQQVFLRSGRFGPYVQLGEAEKPKRCGLPKEWPAQSIDLDRALKLLSLPREVGPHPEDAKLILAGLGRYGPYINHAGAYGRLENIDEVFSVGINRAVDILANRRKARGGGAAAMREIGEHPSGGKLAIFDGRYGPYIKWGKLNTTLPKSADPMSIPLEEAIRLVDEKAKKGTPARSKTTKAKPPAKKSTKPSAKPSAKKSASAKATKLAKK